MAMPETCTFKPFFKETFRAYAANATYKSEVTGKGATSERKSAISRKERRI